MTDVRFTLNGQPVSVSSSSSETTLLDAVRERGLTGAKEGCAEGECGACAVIVTGTSHGRTAYRAINSCLILLPMAEGHDVYTVEALAENGRLSDAQQAMAAAGGSQCGYCTPGFVMSLTAEQYRPDRTGPCDTAALAGNLCRCTGYRPIHDAALSLGAPPQGRWLDRLASPAPTLAEVSSDTFSRPTRLDECLRILSTRPEARIVAGASDLAIESSLHARRFPHLVSVEAIEELREFSRQAGGRLRIGAALTLAEIAERWDDAPDAVKAWLTLFASPPIRNRATLGGNLATASPIGDAAPLLLALDARVEMATYGGAAGPKSRPTCEGVDARIVELSTFFTGYRQTALQPGEMLTAIEIPAPMPQELRFYKISKRRLDDISTVAAAMALDRDASNHVTRARFCFAGVAATPLRLTEAETSVVGRPWNQAAVERVQQVIDRTLVPMSDHRGSKEYRLEVSKSLIDKFFAETNP
jgi:xanthine dehydrogenase small subunit